MLSQALMDMFLVIFHSSVTGQKLLTDITLTSSLLQVDIFDVNFQRRGFTKPLTAIFADEILDFLMETLK